MGTFENVMVGLAVVLNCAVSIAVCYLPDMGHKARFFGVLIDPELRETPAARQIRRRYQAICLGGGLFAVLGALSVGITEVMPSGSRLSTAYSLAIVPLILSALSSMGAHRRALLLPGVDRAEEARRSQPWKLGIFYYNPEDPRVHVPKRMGYGMTGNLAHWDAWLPFVVMSILYSSIGLALWLALWIAGVA